MLENSAKDPETVSKQNSLQPESSDVVKKRISFAGVVKTTMIIKNWLMSVQQDEESVNDHTSEVNVSLVFEPNSKSYDSRMGSMADLEGMDLNNEENQPDEGKEQSQQAESKPNTVPPNPTSAAPNPLQPSPPSFTRLEKLKHLLNDLKENIRSFPTKPIDSTKSFFYYWTFLIYIGFLYNSMMCVIFVFDNTAGVFYEYWLAANAFFDFCYFIDIIINTKIAYMEDGLLITNFRRTCTRYLKSSGFIFDILSLIPLDLFLILEKEISLVRINKLFKFNRVLDFIDKQNIRTNFPNAFRIFHIVIICTLLFHWNTALYFKLSLITGIDSTNFTAWEFNYVKIADPLIAECDIWLTDVDEQCQYTGTTSSATNDTAFIEPMMTFWGPRSRKLEFSNFTKQYVLSFYWSSMTLTTSGQQPYPTASFHNLLEIVDSLLGVLIFAVIVGSVGNVVATMNRSQTQYQNLMDGLKLYMNYRKVKPVVQKRVMEVVAYNQKYGIDKEEANTMEALPARLRGELAVHLHMENLKRVRLLRDCEPNLLYELVLRMEMQMFAPNDMICRKGEIAKEMYIVKKGTLEMLSETGQVINRLKEGASFGELAILKLSGKKAANRRNRSLRSVGYSDVYVLKRENALAVLQDYPEQRNKLIEKGMIVLLKSVDFNFSAKQMIRQQRDSSQAEFSDVDYAVDLQDMGGIKNTDEILVSVSKTLATIEKEISNMYETFQSTSSSMKQRVTRLEQIYYKNRKVIREVNAQRLADQLCI